MKPMHILLLNLIGAALFLSWWAPHLTLWPWLDDSVFWFFNQFITPEHNDWTTVLAILNARAFDMVALGIMGLLFVLALRHDTAPNRLVKWASIGVVMLLTGGVLALFTNDGISYKHASPTLFFEQARLLTDVVSIPTKDSAHNSFPGDHGLMLMVFAAFMLKFATPRIGALSAALVVVLSAPRIMVGAHWFSDVYMGSLSIALITLPWWLGTPLASRLIERISRLLARFRPYG
ncbi:phosphatase PAP2 family protein [Larsenimonas salina]|uniref:phosphatase PAP2 family protein n=1 Tax=Larsenimonas salina TaxID=1295565 RepID=UPI0020739501|nr:phosphatase PAP2 family protein [Larsenimonas salina]MCM5704320.1 phosphatase PAP2 family protein [Larsenimonas salina]